MNYPNQNQVKIQPNRENIINWLHRVRLFEDIKDENGAIEYISKLMSPRHFPAQTTLIQEGDEGHEAYFLYQGQVKILKSMANSERFPVAVLSASDHPFFGEAALLQTDRRSATIITESPCDCHVLNKKGFERLCQEHPHWALPVTLRIARVILGRLHKTNEDLILLYRALVTEVKGE